MFLGDVPFFGSPELTRNIVSISVSQVSAAPEYQNDTKQYRIRAHDVSTPEHSEPKHEEGIFAVDSCWGVDDGNGARHGDHDERGDQDADAAGVMMILVVMRMMNMIQ